MIQKILVPIDGSEHSKKAIEFATGVSQQYGSELYLIHVVADKTIPPEKIKNSFRLSYFKGIATHPINEISPIGHTSVILLLLPILKW